jgi:hypothetical protein
MFAFQLEGIVANMAILLSAVSKILSHIINKEFPLWTEATTVEKVHTIYTANIR